MINTLNADIRLYWGSEQKSVLTTPGRVHTYDEWVGHGNLLSQVSPILWNRKLQVQSKEPLRLVHCELAPQVLLGEAHSSMSDEGEEKVEF